MKFDFVGMTALVRRSKTAATDSILVAFLLFLVRFLDGIPESETNKSQQQQRQQQQVK